MKNYDFPVELVPLFTKIEENATSPDDFAEIPKRKGVMRTDTGAVLGIATDKYALLPHAAVVDGFRAAMGSEEIQEQIQVTKGGAHLYYKIGLPNVKVEVSKGDFVSLMLIAKNSYDGSHSLQVLMGAFRLVCSNGMIVGKKFVEFNHKHVGNDMTLKVEALRSQVEAYKEIFRSTAPTMRKMSDTKLEENTNSLRGEMFDNQHVALPEYLLTEAFDEYVRAGDPSAWGYYNAMTYAITHKMRRESPALAIEYGRVAWATALAHVE